MAQADPGRETRIVPINGRSIVVRRLVDTQLVHLLRYSRILQKEDVDVKDKLDVVERMFNMLHKTVVQPADLEFLIEAEENGDVEIKDLMSFISIFNSEEEPEKPKARRGRPPAKRL